MSVTFFVQDGNGLENEKNSLNVTNTNFFYLMEALGYDVSEEFDQVCGELSATDLISRVDGVLVLLDREPELDAHCEDPELRGATAAVVALLSSGGARVVNCSRHEGYLREKLQVLRNICLVAQQTKDCSVHFA